MSSKFQQTWGQKLKLNLASASLLTLVSASCAHAQDKSPVDKTPPKDVGKMGSAVCSYYILDIMDKGGSTLAQLWIIFQGFILSGCQG